MPRTEAIVAAKRLKAQLAGGAIRIRHAGRGCALVPCAIADPGVPAISVGQAVVATVIAASSANARTLVAVAVRRTLAVGVAVALVCPTTWRKYVAGGRTRRASVLAHAVGEAVAIHGIERGIVIDRRVPGGAVGIGRVDERRATATARAAAATEPPELGDPPTLPPLPPTPRWTSRRWQAGQHRHRWQAHQHCHRRQARQHCHRWQAHQHCHRFHPFGRCRENGARSCLRSQPAR